ncbi:hypothetical protein PGTUg99_003512, partial [Puccinia graminis f. sp. tritici]
MVLGGLDPAQTLPGGLGRAAFKESTAQPKPIYKSGSPQANIEKVFWAVSGLPAGLVTEKFRFWRSRTRGGGVADGVGNRGWLGPRDKLSSGGVLAL